MRKATSIGVLALLFAMAALASPTGAGGQDRDVGEDLQGRLIGSWRLVQLEEGDAGGKVHIVDCIGMLVFTREGRMSVQVMQRNPQTGTAAGPVQYAQGGYEASFGRYEIDARGQAFKYHVEGALVRSLIGQDLVRVFELSGRRLIVKSSKPDEHWRVTWEHD